MVLAHRKGRGTPRICTWRERDIAPVRGYTEVLDHLDQMGRRDSGLLQYFGEQGILSRISVNDPIAARVQRRDGRA